MAANSLKVMLPSLQSTKVPREPILISENEGEKFSCLYLAAFGSVNTLIYQLPHPWRTSDGPVYTLEKDGVWCSSCNYSNLNCLYSSHKQWMKPYW